MTTAEVLSAARQHAFSGGCEPKFVAICKELIRLHDENEKLKAGLHLETMKDMPPQIVEAIDKWLASNTLGIWEVRCGYVPLGLVQYCLDLKPLPNPKNSRTKR